MAVDSILEHPGLTDKSTVAKQLESINLELINRLLAEDTHQAHRDPLRPVNSLKSYDPTAPEVGKQHIAGGKVAALTVAGGQGTRLGFDGPKGTFVATKLLGLSLFGIFAQKIAAAQQRYSCTIPWVVMTSPINNESTIEFFQKHNYFGLAKENIQFFSQGTMPAVDAQGGNLLLASPDSLALSPDCHGGSIKALANSGTLQWLKQHGVRTLSYFQVDNPLVLPIDPAFIGQHLLAGSEFSSKSVQKTSWDEKVGVFAQRGESIGIVEYSDMTQQQAQKLDSKGNLAFCEANIAIHLLSIDFVERLAQEDSLPYHRALKKVPYINHAGELIEPDSPNAIKFEQFIFDALALAKNPLLVRVLRNQEFSAIKNAKGADSPDTAWEAMQQLWKDWLISAGIAQDQLPNTLEIAPLYADSAESFIQRYTARPLPIRDGVVFK